MPDLDRRNLAASKTNLSLTDLRCVLQRRITTSFGAKVIKSFGDGRKIELFIIYGGAREDFGQGRERLGEGDGGGDGDGVDDKDVVISRRSASAFH